MSIRTIAAIFDTAGDAQRAQQNLLSLGVGADDVQVINQRGDAAQAADDKGFWESIKGFFVADDDRANYYAEGVRRGGYLLTAKVEDEYADVACEILESCDAVDLEGRAERWCAEGWSDTMRRTEVHVEDSLNDADDDAMTTTPDPQRNTRTPRQKPTAR